MTMYEDYADQTETMTKTFTDDHRTPVIMTDLIHIRISIISGPLGKKLTLGSLLNNSFAALLLCSTISFGYHHLRAKSRAEPGVNTDVEQAGPRDGDHLREGGVNTSSSHGVRLPNCKPYPVACTRSEEIADRAFQGQLPGVRPKHSRSG
ncbi:uncharacterized protein LOC122319543 [Drosophila yakuba]|uniref:uncharacterized protein LOC122319543 n=1 Tax=Drosophila yakuba TaxID=7245 RepID=UPI001C8A8CCE|nr:uncharacterized protein LOC122319543 [Drosophila yakuba]